MSRSASETKQLAGLRVDDPRVQAVLDRLDAAGAPAEVLERRGAPRLPYRVSATVVVCCADGVEEAFAAPTRNISRTGAAFLTESPLAVGVRCWVEMAMPGGRWVTARARVIRCRDASGGLHEVGIELENPVFPPP